MEQILSTGEAGWTPDQWDHQQSRAMNASADGATYRQSLNAFMHTLLKANFLVYYELFFLF